MKLSATWILGIVIIFSILLSASLYTIKEMERGVKLRFGEIVGADLKPGLGFKIPIVHEIRRFDARAITLDLPSEEFITQEKKRLIVDSFVMWKIKNVGKFYTEVSGLVANAEKLLEDRINEGLRNKFGERTVYEVVSGEREQLMVELTKEVGTLTEQEMGISIVDIRVKRIELPPNVSDSVYDRMRAERNREAREHRSRGKELAEGIRADADRQVTIITAEAYRDAEIIRGQGDAESAAIYAAAYGKDREFYSFYRSLNAYQSAFSEKNDLFVISPDSSFFKYMQSKGSVAKRKRNKQ